ncbi:MAG TPA: hypothetical protein VMR98_00530 [Candidatus Polarisedimenticolaceae bacterium]|nr:hypothetical protein [Candidatus Polarisedimenticolaceae bacterium]
MNRNVLTTIGGLILVGVVVVGTFLYGDQQRQKQLKSDQAAAKQEQTVQPAAAATAPTPSPAASTDKNKPKSAVKPPTPSAQPAAGATAAAPPPIAETPKTGSGLVNVLAVSVIAIVFAVYRRSRKFMLRQV